MTPYALQDDSRQGALERATLLSIASIAVSGVTGAAAVVVALATGALSLLGFGFDAAIDSAASIALVWRFRTERSDPARAERAERLAERAVGLVLVVLALYLAVSAVRALLDGSHPDVTLAGTILPCIGVLVLPPLALAKYRTAAVLGSGALRADSLLTGLAACLAAISLASIVLIQAAGIVWADAVGGLVVAAILAREGLLSVRLTSGR